MEESVTFRVAWPRTSWRPAKYSNDADGSPAASRVTFTLSAETGAALNALAMRLTSGEDRIVAAALHALRLRYEGRLGDASSWTFLQLIDEIGNGPVELERGERALAADAGAGEELILTAKLGTEGKRTGMWRFHRDRFDVHEVIQLDRHFCRLLAALLASPERPVSDADLLAESEYRRAVEVWSETRAEYPRNESIPALFQAVLQERASAIAIADGAEYCTYSQLDEQSGRLAGWLRENGVEGGGRVGIALERSIGMVATMLGVLKAGCAFVPMDPEAARDRLNVMVADAELSLVVTNRTTVRKMPAGVAILSIEDLPDHVAAAPDAGITAESAACVLYPASRQALVGVDISHRAIVRLACNAACGPFGVEEVFAQVPGAAFDAQLFEIFGALLNGARLAMLPGEATHGPAAFAHAIQECRISTLLLASPTFDSIAASHPAAFHSLRNLLVAGEAIDPRWACHVLKTAPPRRLTRIYGTAEATFALAHEIREVAEDATVLPVGRPAPGARAFVLDWNMRPVPAGVAGELYIGGDALAAGYWGNPELTEERFVASPFDPTGTQLYKTGELARYHANGVIERIVNTDAPVRIPATKSDRSKLILRLTRSAGAGR